MLWGKPMQIASCGHSLKEEDDCFLLYSTEYVGILLNTENEQHKWLRGDDDISTTN